MQKTTKGRKTEWDEQEVWDKREIFSFQCAECCQNQVFVYGVNFISSLTMNQDCFNFALIVLGVAVFTDFHLPEH